MARNKFDLQRKRIDFQRVRSFNNFEVFATVSIIINPNNNIPTDDYTVKRHKQQYFFYPFRPDCYHNDDFFIRWVRIRAQFIKHWLDQFDLHTTRIE